MDVDHVELDGVAFDLRQIGERRLAAAGGSALGRRCKGHQGLMARGAVGSAVVEARITGAQVEAGRVVDSGGPVLDVVRREEPIERDFHVIGVAEPCVPVGKRQLQRFHHQVHPCRTARVHSGDTLRVEDPQDLQLRRSLPPRAGLVHRHPCKLDRDGVLPGGAPLRHVLAGEQPRVECSGPVRLLGTVEPIHGVGHEAVVEGPHRRLDLCFPAGARRFGLGEDPLVRVRNLRLGDAGAWAGRIAPRQPDLRRVPPVRPEGTGRSRGWTRRAVHEGIAMAGVGDGRREDVSQPQGAVLQQELHPRAERPRHHGGQHPDARHPGHAQLAQPCDGAAAGAVPWPQSTRGRSAPAGCTMIGTSPRVRSGGARRSGA